jgi:hypothetical protein
MPIAVFGFGIRHFVQHGKEFFAGATGDFVDRNPFRIGDLNRLLVSFVGYAKR